MKVYVKIAAPDQIFDLDATLRQLEENLRAVTNSIWFDFFTTTASWSQPAQFQSNYPKRQGDAYVGGVETSDQRYIWVVRGTRKDYPIPRNPGRVLKYRGTFRSKTVARRITSRTGGKSGQFVYRKAVRHPGIKPREFDLVIRDRREEDVVRAAIDALDAA